jgi:hypothetical protein
MSPSLDTNVVAALKQLVESPCLDHARHLEKLLRDGGYGKRVFSRFNQKSSVEAASQSDRGIAERLSNAFDASLKAARFAVGRESTDRKDSPRRVAGELLNGMIERAEWRPTDPRITCRQPVIQFWQEKESEERRFVKYRPPEGLVSVMVADSGIGLHREEMPKTILDLNSPAKLREFDATGQFGQGGSSALGFCESCLVITQPRFDGKSGEFYWTLIFPEHQAQDSKQDVVRMWFTTSDGLPLVASTADFPSLRELLPGTILWHFGYSTGGWIKRIVGPEQSNPWGRLGRLFFSYPLPFKIEGEYARTDTSTGSRTITGAHFRLVGDLTKLMHQTSPKTETLVVEHEEYGVFSVQVLVLRERSSVRDYVDLGHPVILTLDGINHGEMTRRIIEKADLPELACCSIVEVRLEELEKEALDNIVSNTREIPKRSVFTDELESRLEALLGADEGLRSIERSLQERKARQSSAELSSRMSAFLSRILSPEAFVEPTTVTGGNGKGKRGKRGVERPEIPAADPPKLLEFIYDTPLYIAEGTKVLAKFKSDARPPRYSFHGDNPRCFARLDLETEHTDRVKMEGKQDIDSHGYGSVTLYCPEDSPNPIEDEHTVGFLRLKIQCADGTELQAELQVGVEPAPQEEEKQRKQAIRTEIIFAAVGSDDVRSGLGKLLYEEKIIPFEDCSYLPDLCSLLELKAEDTAYWGVKAEKDGTSVLVVEINAGNPQFKRLLESCKTDEERVEAKERYVRDVVLDCYQDTFTIEEIPSSIRRGDDRKQRAVDIHLNHHKAIRIAAHERDTRRHNAG